MFRTAESVTIGHPDKVCDQIVDAVLDEHLKQDPQARVALEALGAHGKLIISGEVTTSAEVDVPAVARNVYADIGYKDPIEIETLIVKQSPDIAAGVDTGGAGDQGIMVGYATSETPEMLPKPLALARKLVKQLEGLRRGGNLGPDGKTQITMYGDEIKTVLVSTQHSPNLSKQSVEEAVVENVIKPIIADLKGVRILVNPTGRFVIGGFAADSGVSGRKLIVDNYGPDIPIGGGSYAGKDPTKVDRSAAYMTRYLAKYLVKKYALKEALVKVAYAIGVREPLMIEVERTGKDKELAEELRKGFDLTPRGIIDFLKLRQPIYLKTTRSGNFGDSSLPWENVKL
jgi:S-adenosylmethionine synthetase